MPRRAVLLVGLVLLAGCGGGDQPPPPAQAPGATATTDAPSEPVTVRRARCDVGAENCAAVTGRVLFVEAVDPDGDGDAHYVLAGGDVTAPGLSVIDVRRHLRPRRLPRPGDLVSAAGPVYTGSYGQRQIEAVEVFHSRREPSGAGAATP
jgi:hypothetical protein